MIIIQQPVADSLQAAGNDSYFTVSAITSSLTGVTDYKYICDVYVNNELQTTLKTFPDPNINVGVFNLKNIISSFVDSSIDFSVDYFYTQLTTLFGEVDNGSAEVFLSFGEEYLNLGVFTSTRDIMQSNIVNYINASVDFLDQSNLDYYRVYQLYPSGFTAGYFLGSFNPIFDSGKYPTWPEQRSFQYFWLNESNSYNLSAVITTYDGAGQLLGKYQTIATGTTFPSGNKGLRYVACGYSQLDNLAATAYTTLSGGTQIMNSSVASYNIRLKNTSPGSLLTPYANYQVRQSCDRFKRWNVYWLTQYGNYAAWRFDKKSVEKATKTQSQFKKVYGGLDINGNYVVNSYDRNAQTYYTSIENTVTLTTDFLTDAEVLYLKEMFVSPSIYLEDLDGTYWQVVGTTITDNDYTLTKRVNQRIYSLTVNFKLAYNDFRQLG